MALRSKITETDPISVVHFGNDAAGTGGIASVIRGHIGRTNSYLTAAGITTYNQDAKQFLGKNIPLCSALWRLVVLPLRVVVHVHLSQRGSLVREGLIASLAKLKGHMVVATIHGSSLSNPSSATTAALRFVLSRVNVVHGFSDSYRERLKISPEKWEFIPNDVDVPEHTAPEGLREQRVVFAGQVGHRKGIDLLLEAWRLVATTDWRLTVAGPVSGSETEFVFGRPWPDGTEYVGSLDHNDLLALLSTSKILVQPSRAEAFPVAVCEALAQGCAVLGTRVGGMGELLDGAMQLSCEASAQSVAEGLQRLMRNEEELNLNATSGQEYAKRHLSRAAVTADWVRIYRTAANK